MSSRAATCPARSAEEGHAAPITVNQEILRAAGLVRRLDRPMKILGERRRSRRALFVVADAFTASARTKIEAAGGTVSVLEVPDAKRPALGDDAPTTTADATATDAAPPKPCRSRAPAEAVADAADGRGRRRPTRSRRRGREAEAREGRDGSEGRQGSRRPTPGRAPTPTSRGADDAAPTRPPSRPKPRAARKPRATEARHGRVADRVRVAAQRLPRAGYPAADPLRPRDPGRLPAARPGAAAGHRPRRRWRSSSRTTRPFGILDLFAGGGLSQLSIVGLAMNPYINASIIMQLMTGVIPSLQALSREGEYGRQQINQYTRYLTVPLALLQAFGILSALRSRRTSIIGGVRPRQRP